MANFDNGFPPAGTDVTGNNINGVFIQEAYAESTDIRKINSVNISMEKADAANIKKISAVIISKDTAKGNNFVSFL